MQCLLYRANTQQEILTSVSLYYLTDTFPRCIYPYRGVSLLFEASWKNMTNNTDRWAISKETRKEAHVVWTSEP